jgi:hypothetical protein
VTALDRVACVLERARIAGGWIDEEVAQAVLDELDLDAITGEPLPRVPIYTSSVLGHG